MATQKLSDAQIAITIVPKRVRWPESGTSLAWTRAHDCVDALKDVVRSVDLACFEAEQNRDLSSDAVARRRAKLCEQALSKLVTFRAFEIAERALTENVNALERLSDRDPEQVQMLQKLMRALTDLREGIPSTQRMVRDRCKTREVISA